MINEFLTMDCGCTLLVQQNQAMNIVICLDHYNKDKKFFLKMARTKLQEMGLVKK